MRNKFSHNTTFETEYKNSYLENVSDRGFQLKLQEERLAIPEFYKEQMKLTLEGFENTMLLLEKIGNVLFVENKESE